MYQINIYKLIIKEIQQANRRIKKKYFLYITSRHNISKESLATEEIKLKKVYRDFTFVFTSFREGEKDSYINDKKIIYSLNEIGG